MTGLLTFRNFLLLALIISTSSCGSTESKENSESNNTIVNNSEIDQGSNTIANDSELHKESIKLIDNKGVNFEFEIGDKTEFGENFIIDIECMVINETNKEINYLNQSCNGLEYYITITPDSYKARPLINCNATWAIISKLAPKDSIKFKTRILQFKDSEPIEKIGIDFRAIDKFVPFDTLRKKPELVEKTYRSEAQIANVIWGNKK